MTKSKSNHFIENYYIVVAFSPLTAYGLITNL